MGLLAAMGNLDAKTLLTGNRIFEEFKGSLTEQYVLQQLITNEEIAVHYWSAERSSSEIDFLLQYAGEIILLDVKAEENMQAKSLRIFYEKYSPAMAVRTSISDYRKESRMTHIPLYAISKLTSLFNGK